MLKIAVFTGTRADYGLLYWLMRDIQSDPGLTLQLIVSGTHLSPEFGLTYQEIVADGFEIDSKVEMLLSSDTAKGIVKSIGLATLGFADEFSRLAPDLLIILGDRFEALAAAQSAMILKIPILHLHGGEITEGAYDDAIRHAITKLSLLHCTSMETYRQRVIQLGEDPSRVFNVGAIGLDHIKRTNLMTINELSTSLSFTFKNKLMLVTYHPVTLADEPPELSFKIILKALSEFHEYQIILTYPNADNGGRLIIPLIEEFSRNNPGKVLAIPSLGQKRYLSLLHHVDVVVGNSSSGIIEVPSFNKPTVNIGVRQKGRLAAASVLHAPVEFNTIVETIKKAIRRESFNDSDNVSNPYGSGDTSQRIISIIKSAKIQTIKTFYDLNFKQE
ncbi:MAG: UDP-N-acetylglucosamine 2-epimerase (hydrolyzing) [Cellvibrionaceae bacterium]